MFQRSQCYIRLNTFYFPKLTSIVEKDESIESKIIMKIKEDAISKYTITTCPF